MEQECGDAILQKGTRQLYGRTTDPSYCWVMFISFYQKSSRTILYAGLTTCSLLNTLSTNNFPGNFSIIDHTYAAVNYTKDRGVQPATMLSVCLLEELKFLFKNTTISVRLQDQNFEPIQLHAKKRKYYISLSQASELERTWHQHKCRVPHSSSVCRRYYGHMECGYEHEQNISRDISHIMRNI